MATINDWEYCKGDTHHFTTDEEVVNSFTRDKGKVTEHWDIIQVVRSCQCGDKRAILRRYDKLDSVTEN